MTTTLEVNVSFGPRLAWLGLAGLYLAFPGLAATGDSIDARNYQPSPTGVYQNLTITGPSDLSLDNNSAAGQVDLGPVIGGVAWSGKVLVGASDAAAANLPAPTGGQVPRMIVNGNMQVSGCIYLQSGSVVTKRCNWCRAGYVCNPGLW